MQTWAPWPAKARAMASPMPEVEPVTRATLPLSDMRFLQRTPPKHGTAAPHLNGRYGRSHPFKISAKLRQNVTNSAMIRAVDAKPIHPPHSSGHRYAPIPRPDNCGRIALVLQGGGALGAYQGG